jgi:hypothetical protein
MKAYCGSGSTAPSILDLGTRWRWVVRFTPQPLYPQGKYPWYALDRRLSGTQSRSGCGGEEKNSQLLPGLEPPIIQPATQRCTTELSRPLPNECCTFYLKLLPHKISRRLATWSENCKWYSSLPLGAVVSLFCESVQRVSSHNPLCCFWKSVYYYFIIDSVRKLLDIPSYIMSVIIQTVWLYYLQYNFKLTGSTFIYTVHLRLRTCKVHKRTQKIKKNLDF